MAYVHRAAREALTLPTDIPPIDLDWSSYAGKRRHSPWYILSALLLAENGYKVCMHGAEGHTAGRMYTSDALGALGIDMCLTLNDAEKALNETNFDAIYAQHQQQMQAGEQSVSPETH